jgi:pimeloyl-ACP methyl ester carboxylesterase
MGSKPATYSQTPTLSGQTSTGIDFAYRRIGQSGVVPLVLANYFAANLDDWDPLIVDALAAERDVITFDYAGVGNTTARTAATMAGIAADSVAFLAALGLGAVDFMGFSLGGMVVQEFASTHPDMVRRMILCSTAPRGGENLAFAELSIDELDDPTALLLASFFTPSEQSQAAGQAYIQRLACRDTGHDAPVVRNAAEAQLRALREWGEVPATGRYATLPSIRQPALIVHGNNDMVIDSVNAMILEKRLADARLLILPDAGHGAHSQHSDIFVANALLFLSN